MYKNLSSCQGGHVKEKWDLKHSLLKNPTSAPEPISINWDVVGIEIKGFNGNLTMIPTGVFCFVYSIAWNVA